jgi:hemolysin III
MTKTVAKKRFSKEEELANAISHLIGMVLSVIALFLMINYSIKRGDVWHIVSTSVFGFSMIVLYFSSFLTHWLPAGKSKDSLFTVDQAAIFILIAGTYTPISLVTLHGTVGWSVLIIEWGLAVTGIIRLLLRKNLYDSGVNILDILIYVAIGWLVLFVGRMNINGFLWIITGGIFYSAGIIFYKVAKFPYHHLVWHIMVMGGTFSHFIAIFFFIIP